MSAVPQIAEMAFSNAKTLRGCCINWVNSSTYTPQALSYGVWNSCGVESPGFCDSPLSLTPATIDTVTIDTVTGSAASIVETNYINFLLVIIASLICQYINFMCQ